MIISNKKYISNNYKSIIKVQIKILYAYHKFSYLKLYMVALNLIYLYICYTCKYVYFMLHYKKILKLKTLNR